MEEEIDGLITRRLLSADARAAMMALLQGKAMVQLASSQGVIREPDTQEIVSGLEVGDNRFDGG
jgi:hypothetical protein